MAPPPLNWPTKDPRDVLDYQIDIAPAVAGNSGDIISAVTISITPNNPGDLALNSASVDGTSAILWLAGGQAGIVYTITLLMATTNGRTVQRSVLLPVLELSAQPIPGTAIQISTGVVLTDQNGNPVLSA